MSIQKSIFTSTVKLNNNLFRNVFMDVSKADAHKSVMPNTSSMIFIGGHMVNARYYIAKLAGMAQKRPLQDTFTSYDPNADYGGPQNMVEIWDRIADDLGGQLAGMQEEALLEVIPSRFPVQPKTLVNNITFLLQHESYHLGQLGLLRKALGLPAVSYASQKRT